MIDIVCPHIGCSQKMLAIFRSVSLEHRKNWGEKTMHFSTKNNTDFLHRVFFRMRNMLDSLCFFCWRYTKYVQFSTGKPKSSYACLHCIYFGRKECKHSYETNANNCMCTGFSSPPKTIVRQTITMNVLWLVPFSIWGIRNSWFTDLAVG